MSNGSVFHGEFGFISANSRTLMENVPASAADPTSPPPLPDEEPRSSSTLTRVTDPVGALEPPVVFRLDPSPIRFTPRPEVLDCKDRDTKTTSNRI